MNSLLVRFYGLIWIGFAMCTPVDISKLEQGDLVEGDIRLQSDNGVISVAKRWPGGVVPYAFDAAYTVAEKEFVLQAIAEYTSRTCIAWLPRTDQQDYIYFTKEPAGCWSFVGRIKGKQEINYQFPGCEAVGIMLHEMAHSIGFWHEQSRPDRDAYVAINIDNAWPGYEVNFDKVSSKIATTFNVEYNYGSVMHYSSTSFSSNGQPTVVALKPLEGKVMGQRDGFADTDVWKINRMYNCTTKDQGVTTAAPTEVSTASTTAATTAAATTAAATTQITTTTTRTNMFAQKLKMIQRFFG